MDILDKFETLTNLGNSILNFYGIGKFHDSYKKLDDLLANNKDKKICLVLFDGFGKNIIEKYKDDIPYIYSHIYSTFNSIYPPTTVAATTALTTGKYPCETGLLGWNQNFKELNAYVDVFLNRDKVKDKKLDIDMRKDILKPVFIDKLINAHFNKECASFIHSFEYKSIDQFFFKVDETLKTNIFTYAYCAEPDHLMHQEGTSTKNVRNTIIILEDRLKRLVESNKDTLFILVADHGFVDIENIYIKEDKELIETLKDKDATFSIEGRFASFEVEDKEKFIEIYNKRYKEYFVLKTKEEILDEHYFGYGEEHPLFKSFLGDFFLLSKSKYNLADSDDFKLNGAHAGITKEEKELYMMIFNS